MTNDEDNEAAEAGHEHGNQYGYGGEVTSRQSAAVKNKKRAGARHTGAQEID